MHGLAAAGCGVRKRLTRASQTPPGGSSPQPSSWVALWRWMDQDTKSAGSKAWFGYLWGHAAPHPHHHTVRTKITGDKKHGKPPGFSHVFSSRKFCPVYLCCLLLTFLIHEGPLSNSFKFRNKHKRWGHVPLSILRDILKRIITKPPPDIHSTINLR